MTFKVKIICYNPFDSLFLERFITHFNYKCQGNNYFFLMPLFILISTE